VRPRRCDRTSRTCPSCNEQFQPVNPRKTYCSERCRKRAESRRRRGESLSDRVVRAKGRRCDLCNSERPGRRTAFFWDREETDEGKAILLCHGCLRYAHATRCGQDRLDEYEDRLIERTEIEQSDDFKTWFGADNLRIRYLPEIIGVQPPQRTHHKKGVTPLNTCVTCKPWPCIYAAHGPLTAEPEQMPEDRPKASFAERYTWDVLRDDTGAIVAAVCSDVEPLAAAA
jgi:hypothetical protein